MGLIKARERRIINLPMYPLSYRSWFLCMTLVFLVFMPLTIRAEGTAVVFFSGLCNSPDACRASEQAFRALSPRLPAGTTLYTPQLSEGAFANQSSLSSTISSIAGQRVVLISYSAGYKALGQLVNAMDSSSLQQIKTIVSLESEYNGFYGAVNRVKTVNPSVDVRYVRSGQFGTNHGRLPGNDGVAQEIAGLVGGNTSNLPTTSAGYNPNIPLSQQFNLNPQNTGYPAITSNMPVAAQAPIATAFSPQAQPVAPAPTPVSQNLLSAGSEANIPAPLITDSLLGTTSIAAQLTGSLNIPSTTAVSLVSPPAPTTFGQNPPAAAPTWMSGPLSAFDIRLEISAILTKAESILRDIFQRLSR